MLRMCQGLSHSLRTKIFKKRFIHGKEKEKSGGGGKSDAEPVTPPRKCD
jgi:hypothetical protein